MDVDRDHSFFFLSFLGRPIESALLRLWLRDQANRLMSEFDALNQLLALLCQMLEYVLSRREGSYKVLEMPRPEYFLFP